MFGHDRVRGRVTGIVVLPGDEAVRDLSTAQGEAVQPSLLVAPIWRWLVDDIDLCAESLQLVTETSVDDGIGHDREAQTAHRAHHRQAEAQGPGSSLYDVRSRCYKT